MLSRVISLPLQVVVAWLVTPLIVELMPSLGRWELFGFGVIAAALVWVVGVVVSEVMQADLPSSGMLIAAVSLAIIGAACAMWLPAFVPMLSPAERGLPLHVYPFVGALLGYQIERLPSRASN